MENLALNIETQISVRDLVVALGVGTLLAYLLRLHFVRFGRSVNNRSQFGDIFIFIVLTTTLIISLIKTSLALSLGLVGALSIVRFRTPIKEPEELAYLFVAIAIGLGLGANQTLITFVAFGIILVVATVFRQHTLKTQTNNIYVTMTSESANKELVGQVQKFLEEHVTESKVRRADLSNNATSAVFTVNMPAEKGADSLLNDLGNQFSSVQFSLVDRDVQVGL